MRLQKYHFPFHHTLENILRESAAKMGKNVKNTYENNEKNETHLLYDSKQC